MTDSDAEALLREAEATQHDDWLQASLLTAAAVDVATGERMVVVGGTAQAYWTGINVYNPTDLDLWFPGPLTGAIQDAMTSMGFHRHGRHWVRTGLNVPVEFPSGAFAGAVERVIVAGPKTSPVSLIGVDDLYLDRLEQATSSQHENTVEFDSALAVATYRFDLIDWRLVSERISEAFRSNPLLGQSMRRHNRRIRRLVRAGWSEDSLPD